MTETEYNTRLTAQIAVPVGAAALETAYRACVKALADAGYDPHFLRLEKGEQL